ncbi:MAG: PhzF family phenazine biosynthesis protein [Bacteroidota bacterium]
MKTIKFFQVDAFTAHLFGGNPAAVCMLDQWLDDEMMQSVAAENNLSETAFLTRNPAGYDIRWFTPTVEVDLCGHATLASAFVIFNHFDYQKGEIIFNSPRSGELKVRRDGRKLFLDFPADEFFPCEMFAGIIKSLGFEPRELYRGKTDFMAVVDSEDEVISLRPDFNAVATLDARGLIVTAPGNEVDFVSRFFGPQSGVDEDPVTGSAHTTLIPYWAARLVKNELVARQVSARVGSLDCRNLPPRVIIGGEAQLFASGEIYV